MRWSIVFTTYVSEQGCQLYSMVRVFLETSRQGFAVMFEMSCDKLSNLRRKGTPGMRISCRQPRRKGLRAIVAVGSCLRGSLEPSSSGNVRSPCLPGEGAPEDRIGWSHKVMREQQSSPRERAKKWADGMLPSAQRLPHDGRPGGKAPPRSIEGRGTLAINFGTSWRAADDPRTGRPKNRNHSQRRQQTTASRQ